MSINVDTHKFDVNIEVEKLENFSKLRSFILFEFAFWLLFFTQTSWIVCRMWKDKVNSYMQVGCGIIEE